MKVWSWENSAKDLYFFFQIFLSLNITLSKIGNSALKIVHTVSSICLLLPGSCPANWLQGNARISNPATIVPAEKLKPQIYRDIVRKHLENIGVALREWVTNLGFCTFHTEHSISCSLNVWGHCRIKNKIQ